MAHTRSILNSTSRSDLKRSLTPKKLASLAATSTVATMSLELRCIKHSPRMMYHETIAPYEAMLFEAAVWRKAFDAMGVLTKRNFKEAIPFTVLNKTPYHCPSSAHTYKVSHGTISHVEGGSVGGVNKKKEVKASVCNCVDQMALPRTKEDITASSIIRCATNQSTLKTKVYIPKSCVLVWWNSVRYNAEKICDWLLSFGPYLFTINKGETTLLVCFDSITSSYKAVNYPQANTGIRVTWYDVRLYNNGYYSLFKNYAISKDEIWSNYYYWKRQFATPLVSPRSGTQSRQHTAAKIVNF